MSNSCYFHSFWFTPSYPIPRWKVRGAWEAHRHIPLAQVVGHLVWGCWCFLFFGIHIAEGSACDCSHAYWKRGYILVRGRFFARLDLFSFCLFVCSVHETAQQLLLIWKWKVREGPIRTLNLAITLQNNDKQQFWVQRRPVAGPRLSAPQNCKVMQVGGQVWEWNHQESHVENVDPSDWRMDIPPSNRPELAKMTC